MPQMKAMIANRAGAPLEALIRPVPVPGPSEVLIEAPTCGGCRTGLHVVDSYIPIIVLIGAAKVTYVRVPTLDEVPYPVKMEPNLVVEFYSR